MEDGTEVRRLLREILDTQREHLAEYRRVTERLLGVQTTALAQQERTVRLARRLAAVIGVLLVLALGAIAYVLVLLRAATEYEVLR